MSDARGLTYGLALGAGLMFLLDPRQGRQRRAKIRDKSVRAAHEVEDAAAIGARDFSHRVEGAVARLFSRFEEEEHVSDDVLVARVRAKLGHVSANPHAIHVTAKGDGCVELKGPILESEAQRVLSAVSDVRGVRTIDDDLERRPDAEEKGLSGRPAVSPLTQLWNPSTRLFAGLAAASLALSSLLRGRPLGFLLGGGGVLAIARNMAQRTPGMPLPQLGARRSERGEEREAHQEEPQPRGLREAYPPESEWSPVSERGEGVEAGARETEPERR